MASYVVISRNRNSQNRIDYSQLRASLNAGISASVIMQGDSLAEGVNTYPKALYDMLYNRYSSIYDFNYLLWNSGTQDYDVPVFTNGSYAGRWALINTQGLSFPTASTPNITTDLDIGGFGVCNQYNTGSTQVIVGKYLPSGTNVTCRLAINGTGFLQLLTSPDGTVGSQLQFVSTVAIQTLLAAGINVGFRATLDVDNGAAGKTATFYYSLDNGSTWNQIGLPVTQAGTTSIYTLGANVWEAGCTGSTTSLWGGKLFRVFVKDGINGSPVTPYSIEAWNRIGNGVTFQGRPVFTMFIAGQSGATISFLTDATRIKKMLPYNNFCAIFLNSCHNEGTTTLVRGTAFQTTLNSWLTTVRAKLPLGDIYMVGENPENPAVVLGAYEFTLRNTEVNQWGRSNDIPVIDMASEFYSFADWSTRLVQADGIHPTQPEGYNLMAQTVYNFII